MFLSAAPCRQSSVIILLNGSDAVQFKKWWQRMTCSRNGKREPMIRAGSAVLSMRLFNMPWDIVSYWAGLQGIRFRDFYIASMIPLVPVSFLYTYFGSRVFEPYSAGFIISLAVMFIMGAIPYIKARWDRKVHG